MPLFHSLLVESDLPQHGDPFSYSHVLWFHIDFFC
jgi:hypothetical protein